MVSPYNTYMNTDFLQPIVMPDITALEAVLNPEKKRFHLFLRQRRSFCYYEFAATLAEHNKNARK
jgi:UPF0755 protein